MHTAAAAVAYTVAGTAIITDCCHMYLHVQRQPRGPATCSHTLQQASKHTTIKQKTRSLTALTLRRS